MTSLKLPDAPPLVTVTVNGTELQLPKGKNLLQALLEADLAAHRGDLKALIKDDFCAHRTMLADGWMLSLTEARLCALANPANPA